MVGSRGTSVPGDESGIATGDPGGADAVAGGGGAGVGVAGDGPFDGATAGAVADDAGVSGVGAAQVADPGTGEAERAGDVGIPLGPEHPTTPAITSAATHPPDRCRFHRATAVPTVAHLRGARGGSVPRRSHRGDARTSLTTSVRRPASSRQGRSVDAALEWGDERLPGSRVDRRAPPWRRCRAALRARVAPARSHRGCRALRPGDPGRHGLRGGRRSSPRHRAVRDDRAAARLRPRRPLACAGARTRLVARADDRRCRAAARSRERRARGCAGRSPGGPDGRRAGRRSCAAAGLRHRPAVTADPARLPQRHRAGRDRQPAPEGARYRRARWLGLGHARPDRARGPRRYRQRLCRARGSRVVGRHRARATRRLARPRGPDRRRRIDGGHGGARPG
ncbi:hypothetical protein GALL_450440 [mine drainage metagenome]|uniref:Uncharacterized protein n=1 Tax=mine drainage metagenome TaxID=410659 RepID=A0A1J5PPB3_9ZZZZ